MIVVEPEQDVAVTAVPFDEREERALPGEAILAGGVAYHPASTLARVVGSEGEVFGSKRMVPLPPISSSHSCAGYISGSSGT